MKNTSKELHRTVFITGGTGYMGRHLILGLLEHGYEVSGLARKESQQRMPPGCATIIGDALDKDSLTGLIPVADTFVHLVGVPHPNPSKAQQFRAIDLASVQAAVPAALAANVKHFVYVSVAQPAPVMKAYIEVRAQCEALIRDSGLNATILRPWYVLGPGHWWPYLLLPAYWVFERLPATRDTAQNLGLVTLGQMIAALLYAIEHPCEGIRVLAVPQIRRCGKEGTGETEQIL